MIVTVPSARDLDERVRHERRPAALAALREQVAERIDVGGDHQAAAGERGDAEGRSGGRERAELMMRSYLLPAAASLRRAVDAFADPQVGAAAAEVAAHRGVDVARRSASGSSRAAPRPP